MAHWSNSYIEFHEKTGLDGPYIPPKPVWLRCPQCFKEFRDVDDLSRHRFEEHPYRQPILIIDNKEIVGRRHAISRELAPENIRCHNVTDCSVNGESISLDTFSERICAVRQGFLSVVLKNALGEVEVTYDLDISIPELRDTLEVDRRFFEFSKLRNLSAMSVNDFIQIAGEFESTRIYVDGLSSYLYGVLAKDQRGDISLSRKEGRARMTHALRLLVRFDTPLARIVTQIIHFNFNTFNDGSALDNSPQMAHGMKKYWYLLHPTGVMNVTPSAGQSSNVQQVPLDVCTSQLLEWGSLSAVNIAKRRKELEKALSDDGWVPDDRLKVSVILADALEKIDDLAGAALHARRLRHDVSWGEWAERLILVNS